MGTIYQTVRSPGPASSLSPSEGATLPSSWTHQLHSTHLVTHSSLPAGLNLWTIYTIVRSHRSWSSLRGGARPHSSQSSGIRGCFLRDGGVRSHRSRSSLRGGARPQSLRSRGVRPHSSRSSQRGEARPHSSWRGDACSHSSRGRRARWYVPRGSGARFRPSQSSGIRGCFLGDGSVRSHRSRSSLRGDARSHSPRSRGVRPHRRVHAACSRARSVQWVQGVRSRARSNPWAHAARSVQWVHGVRSRARSNPWAHAVRSRACSNPWAHAVRSVPGAHAVRSVPGAHAVRSVQWVHGVRFRAHSNPWAHAARCVPGAHAARSVPGAHAARSVPGAHAVRSVQWVHGVRSRARSNPWAHAARSVPGAHAVRSRVRSNPWAHAARSVPGAHAVRSRARSVLGANRVHSRALCWPGGPASAGQTTGSALVSCPAGPAPASCSGCPALAPLAAFSSGPFSTTWAWPSHPFPYSAPALPFPWLEAWERLEAIPLRGGSVINFTPHTWLPTHHSQLVSICGLFIHLTPIPLPGEITLTLSCVLHWPALTWACLYLTVFMIWPISFCFVRSGHYVADWGVPFMMIFQFLPVGFWFNKVKKLTCIWTQISVFPRASSLSRDTNTPS